MEVALAQWKWLRISGIGLAHFCQSSRYTQFPSSTDTLVEHLTLKEGSKRHNNLLKYFQTSFEDTPSGRPVAVGEINRLSCNGGNSESVIKKGKSTINELVFAIEKNIKDENDIPNSDINYLTIYFAKNGNTNGIKAIQFIIKKYNNIHFLQQSQYQHYLAESLWINGKIEESLLIFLNIYENLHVRSKIKLMLKSLFPLLISQHGDGILRKSIFIIEQFTLEKQDFIILAFLWKELFQSIWFSDNQLADQILERNPDILQIIQWMIPDLGKEFLKNHKIDSFYRLLELTLKYKISLKIFEEILIRLLFDYYYIHQNIERCSAVVKYSANLDSSITEDQQRRYISLLLKSKNSESSKLIIKKPQNIRYTF